MPRTKRLHIYKRTHSSSALCLNDFAKIYNNCQNNKVTSGLEIVLGKKRKCNASGKVLEDPKKIKNNNKKVFYHINQTLS